MRLEPLYAVTFTAPEAWSAEVAAGEGRGFLLAEGRSTGHLSARFRAANFPLKRTARSTWSAAEAGKGFCAALVVAAPPCRA